MKCKSKKSVLILLVAVVLVILFLKDCNDSYEDVVHLRSDNKEFKKKPENSIESTILHREKEVYDHVFHSSN